MVANSSVTWEYAGDAVSNARTLKRVDEATVLNTFPIGMCKSEPSGVSQSPASPSQKSYSPSCTPSCTPYHVFNINKENEKYGNEKKNTLKINNGTQIYSVGNIYYIKVKKEI